MLCQLAKAAMTEEPTGSEEPSTLQLACHVLAAYVRRNTIPAGEVPGALRNIHQALIALAGGTPVSPERPKPAVPVKQSVTRNYIVCLEDGRKLKMLKRYLRTKHGMTPEEYRVKWRLPASYPMVAPAYAAQRSAFAKSIGLGRKPQARRRRK